MGGLQMKETGIEREDLLIMLMEMNHQLEDLEADLHSSTVKYCNNWYQSQEKRLIQCDQKLSSIEQKVESFKEDHNSVNLPYSGQKVVKLELGF